MKSGLEFYKLKSKKIKKKKVSMTTRSRKNYGISEGLTETGLRHHQIESDSHDALERTKTYKTASEVFNAIGLSSGKPSAWLPVKPSAWLHPGAPSLPSSSTTGDDTYSGLSGSTYQSGESVGSSEKSDRFYWDANEDQLVARDPHEYQPAQEEFVDQPPVKEFFRKNIKMISSIGVAGLVVSIALVCLIGARENSGFQDGLKKQQEIMDSDFSKKAFGTIYEPLSSIVCQTLKDVFGFAR